MRSSAQDIQARDFGRLSTYHLNWAVLLGSIFRATHLHTKQVVALKVQDVNHECPSNRYERRLYPLLQGGVGMPRLYAAGVAGMWDYLAIELLGTSLDSLYRRSGKEVMDIQSVLSIAIQVVSELQAQFITNLNLPRDRLSVFNSCIVVEYYIVISN